MATTINLNNFAQQNGAGTLQQMPNQSVFNVKFNPNSSTASLKPCDPVKLIAGTSDIPLVDYAGTADDLVYGFVIIRRKNANPEKGTIIEIASDECVMYMTAGGAIARGEYVTASDNQTVVKTTTATDVMGICIDTASASGDLVRVLIKNMGFATHA